MGVFHGRLASQRVARGRAAGDRMGETERRDWLTVPEAAKRSGLSERYVLNLIEDKRVVAERAAAESTKRGVWLIHWPSLLNFITKK